MVIYGNSLYLFLAFFFVDSATTEIYTLSLHDALPILRIGFVSPPKPQRCLLFMILLAKLSAACPSGARIRECRSEEHTSNSSHPSISYAVFCLKKKKRRIPLRRPTLILTTP